MIVANGKYYLYRHIRLDKNEPFYIGVGTKTKEDVKYGYYRRAVTDETRNEFWKNIVQKTPYEVEILLESNDPAFVRDKETEFINLHGRRDLNKGPLCNLTDGGFFGLNRASSSIKKQLDTAKVNGTYDEMVDRIKKFSFAVGSNNHYQDKKTYLYDVSGKFINEFTTRSDCAKFIKSHMEVVSRGIRLKESHKGYIFLNEYLGSQISVSSFTIRRNKNKPIQKIDVNGNVVDTYDSLTEAALEIGSLKQSIGYAMRKSYRHKGFYWKYIN